MDKADKKANGENMELLEGEAEFTKEKVEDENIINPRVEVDQSGPQSGDDALKVQFVQSDPLSLSIDSFLSLLLFLYFS